MNKYLLRIVLISYTLSIISCEDRWVWGDSNGKSSNRNGNSGAGKFGRNYDDGLRAEHSIAQPVVAQPNKNRNKIQQDEESFFNGNNGNRNGNYNGPQRGPQSRYEVEENLNSGLITIQPSRPFPNPNNNIISLPPRPIPGPIPLPQNQRPGERFPPGPGGDRLPNREDNFRPGRPGPQGSLVPAQSRPGGSIIAGPPPSVGILTGPVPSWEKGPLNKNGDPTSFQNCKCAHSFNCKAPGIQFGKCDQGKQYCCFNDLNGPNKNQQGPNGPNRPFREGPNDSEGFGSEPFILTGPSGPGGHYGSKPNNRPFRNGPNEHGPNRPFNSRDYDDFDFPSNNRYNNQFERSSKRS